MPKTKTSRPRSATPAKKGSAKTSPVKTALGKSAKKKSQTIKNKTEKKTRKTPPGAPGPSRPPAAPSRRPPLGVLDVLRVLRERFERVRLRNEDEEAETAEVWVSMVAGADGAFGEALRHARRRSTSDDAWLVALEVVLQDRLEDLPPHHVEFLSDYDFVDEPPNWIALFFRFGSDGATSGRTRDIGGADVRGRGDEEAVRSRKRRASQRWVTLVSVGRLREPGRQGYVEVEDPLEAEWRTWRPAPAAVALMTEALSVWGTPGCTTRNQLAAHLGTKGLTTLDGRPFNKDNLRRLLIAIELVRGNDE